MQEKLSFPGEAGTQGWGPSTVSEKQVCSLTWGSKVLSETEKVKCQGIKVTEKR